MMIKKKLYYVVVNDNDSPLTLEIFDIVNEDMFKLIIANELSTTIEYIRVLNRQNQTVSVFSILDYIVTVDLQMSIESFDKYINHVKRYIQTITDLNLFYLFLRQFRKEDWDRFLLKDIISKYKFPYDIDDIEELYDGWEKQFNESLSITVDKAKELGVYMESIFNSQCLSDQTTDFQTKRIKIKAKIPYNHSLYYHLDHVRLNSDWVISFYQDLVRTSTFDLLGEDFENAISDRDVNVLSIYNKDFEQNVTVSYSDIPNTLETTLDIVPNVVDYIDMVHSLFNEDPIGNIETIAVSGTFYIKNKSYNKLILQDFIMNDEIASKFFYINELDKATRFGDNIIIHFENIVTAILINNENDSSPVPPILSYFRDRYIKVNVTKAKGSQNNLDNIIRFQKMLCAILSRFESQYEFYQELYLTYIPSITFPLLQLPTTEEEKEDVTNFANKYKNIFKKTGYKTSCRPKSRVPTIITKEEASTLNPLYVLKFPKPNDPKLDIPMEYLTCKDPDNPFPGITSLSGGDLFVPCCFNKNPRSSKAFIEYYQGERAMEPRGTEHVKSETQLIKTLGDVGKLPPMIHKFMISLLPTYSFLRVGTEDDANSILHSINYLMGKDVKTSLELRRDIARYFGKNLKVILQENADIMLDDLQEYLNNVQLYFDPRRFLRLLEIYYNVNIVIFTKSKKTEEIEILHPNYKSFHVRYEFDSRKPFLFLYEHWGTSPDRYTKRQFPVCEMIVSVSGESRQKQFKLTRTEFIHLQDIYRVLFYIYPLKQNTDLWNTTLVRMQMVDNYGKLRGVMIELAKNKYIYMESLHPLPPIYIPDESSDMDDIMNRLHIPTIEFLTSNLNNVEMIRMVQFKDNKYIVIRWENYIWKLQIRSNVTNGFEKIHTPFLMSFESLQEKRYMQIARDKRIARIVIDYVLYLYSTFFFGSFAFEDFFRQHTRIIPGFVYPIEFSENIFENEGMMENNILILNSKDVEQKLKFTIQYYIMYHYEELKNYKKNNLLPNFWETPFDFEHSKDIYYIRVFSRLLKRIPSQISQCSLNDIIGKRGYWYNYDERPIREYNHPYIYIQVDSQQEAIAMTSFWRKYKYIPSYKVEEPVIDNMNVMIYDQGKWMNVPEEMLSIMDLVFIVMNKDKEMYVLLGVRT